MRDIGRAVPALAFGVLRVDLDQLGEVATVAERGGDRGKVRLETIAAQLKALRCGCCAQALDEHVRGGLAAPAQSEVENEFGIALDGDEAIRVAHAVVVRLRGEFVALLLENVSPDFIDLYVLHGN